MSERGSHYVNSIDSTSVMVVKGAPAVGGTVLSFANIPWADVAAVLTCIYTGCLLADWIWKKVRAYLAWKKERIHELPR